MPTTRRVSPRSAAKRSIKLECEKPATTSSRAAAIGKDKPTVNIPRITMRNVIVSASGNFLGREALSTLVMLAPQCLQYFKPSTESAPQVGQYILPPNPARYFIFFGYSTGEPSPTTNLVSFRFVPGAFRK